MRKCYADKSLNISKHDFERPQNMTININCSGTSENTFNEIRGGDTDF